MGELFIGTIILAGITTTWAILREIELEQVKKRLEKYKKEELLAKKEMGEVKREIAIRALDIYPLNKEF